MFSFFPDAFAWWSGSHLYLQVVTKDATNIQCQLNHALQIKWHTGLLLLLIEKNNNHHNNQNHNPDNLPVFDAAAAASFSTAAAAAAATDFIRVSGDRGYAPFLFIVQHVM